MQTSAFEVYGSYRAARKSIPTCGEACVLANYGFGKVRTADPQNRGSALDFLGLNSPPVDITGARGPSK
jgi:hypothetical protein